MGETRTSTTYDGTIAGGATRNDLVGVAERDAVVIFWSMTNATAAGDLATTVVRAVDPDGNVLPTVLTPQVVSAAALNGSVATVCHRYDIKGLNKVQIRTVNGAGSSRDLRVKVNHYWA